jgi:hypothetical protein
MLLVRRRKRLRRERPPTTKRVGAVTADRKPWSATKLRSRREAIMIEHTKGLPERAPLSWDEAASIPVEITAPDSATAAALLAEVHPHFPSELVAGDSWGVKLHAPPETGEWVFKLLALIERWLDVCRLPSGQLRYGGRSYVIPAGAPGFVTAAANLGYGGRARRPSAEAAEALDVSSSTFLQA